MAAVAVLLIVAFATGTWGLRCLDCDESQCSTVECNGTSVLRAPPPCYCCDSCAKAAGESCGGSWHWFGFCDSGLLCVDESGVEVGIHEEGICKP